MDQFNELDNPTTGAAPEVEDDAKKAAKKARNQELNAKVNAAMEKTLVEDPTYAQRVGRLRDSIAVMNSLGFGDSGGLVQAAAADPTTGAKRKVAPTSAIVGYVIRNVGKEAITFRSEKWTKDPQTGKFVGQPVDVTIKPGESANLSRKYMTVLASMPEFSLEFKNGSMSHSSAKFDESNIDELLASYYFSFSDPEVKVHSDEIKLAIGVKTKSDKGGEAVWVVKPEYEADFGFLNNTPEKPATKRTKTAGPDAKAKVANYLQSLIRNGGQ